MFVLLPLLAIVAAFLSWKVVGSDMFLMYLMYNMRRPPGKMTRKDWEVGKIVVEEEYEEMVSDRGFDDIEGVEGDDNEEGKSQHSLVARGMRVGVDIYSVSRLFILLNYLSASFVEVCIFHDNTYIFSTKSSDIKIVYFEARIAVQFVNC